MTTAYDWILCSLGLMIVAGGCAPPVPRSGSAAPQPVSVRTVQPAAALTHRISLQPATVHAYFVTEVQSKVGGYVSHVRVDLGDLVDPTTVLAQIDVPELQQHKQMLQAKVARLRAGEASAKAGIELARAKLAASAADVAHAHSQLTKADALVAGAESEYGRVSQLVERRSIQPQRLDEALQSRDAALAERQALESNIVAAEAQVAVSKAQLSVAEYDAQAAEADSRVAEADLRELEVMIQYATVRAPLSGVVTQRHVQPGALVEPSTKLYEVSQIDKVRVRIAVPEREAAFVNVGDSIELTFPSFPDEKFTAQVSRTSHSLDDSTRTMLVEVDLDNADRKLLPGMFGQASISYGLADIAATLPARAVRYAADGQAYVYALTKESTIASIPVETGHDDGKAVEILSGIATDQRFVDASVHSLADGQSVTVIP